MLARTASALAAVATGQGLLRVLFPGTASVWARSFATGDSSDRPMSGDPGVRQARGQQPSSLAEPPLLHDSLSEATYDYKASSRATTCVPRVSSITEPDYYLHNSLSEGAYGMPQVLQRSASFNTTRGQGFSTAKQRPIVQRIVVANRAGDGGERLHDSFAHADYDSPYKSR